ncbi:MAG: hypothetical protein JW939_04950 [Candidatus Thermoplasmatota archaeon]|nr:hypothetical protein [Candidatus Thermoplasmatota archaeon]
MTGYRDPAVMEWILFSVTRWQGFKDDRKGVALFFDGKPGERDIVIPRPDYQSYTLNYYVRNLPVGVLSGDVENDTLLFEAHDVVWVVTYHDREDRELDFMGVLENRSVEHFDDFYGLNVWRLTKGSV